MRAGFFTSFSNSASFQSEAFHTSWASASFDMPLSAPRAVTPAATPDTKDLRVTFCMFVLLRNVCFGFLLIDRRSNTETSEKLKFRLFKALASLFGPPSPNHEEQKD